MSTSNDHQDEPEVPPEDYNSDFEPESFDNSRPANQTQVLPIVVQKELQDKITTKETSRKIVTINSTDPDIEFRMLRQNQPIGTQEADDSSAEVLATAPELEEEIEEQPLETDVNGNDEPLPVPSDPPALDKLTKDLGQLLDSEIDTDVTIKAGRHTFPAHRLILKARCPELLRTARAVVPLLPPPVPPLSSSTSASSCCGSSSKKSHAAMPEQRQPDHETQLSMSYVIDLPSPPFTEDLVRGLLRYIYTTRLEDLSGIAQELLVVAGDHRLLELKARLERHLSDSLNDDNCVQLLVFADQERSQWDCRKLKRSALKYIKDRIRVILGTEQFRKLKHERCKLLEEVLLAVVFGDDWIQETM